MFLDENLQSQICHRSWPASQRIGSSSWPPLLPPALSEAGRRPVHRISRHLTLIFPCKILYRLFISFQKDFNLSIALAKFQLLIINFISFCWSFFKLLITFLPHFKIPKSLKISKSPKSFSLNPRIPPPNVTISNLFCIISLPKT